MESREEYDYVIAGAGLAGLSLTYKIINHPQLKDKTILLIDKDTKDKNDRTWCYWTEKESPFPEIVNHRWHSIDFSGSGKNKTLSLDPFRYEMVRGLDFYEFIIPILKAHPNCTFIHDEIVNIEETDQHAIVTTNSNSYQAKRIFKSYLDKRNYNNDHFVWQHFKGWWIETQEDTFDTDKATFMDFRTTQEHGTAFFYVLPYSTKEALVEIAIFSKDKLASKDYDPLISDYLDLVGIKTYKVLEEEVGAIPMTTFDFQKGRTSRVIPIGTEGGSVKASSGFAFTRIQKMTDKLTTILANDNLSQWKYGKNRYTFFDKIFMNVIISGKVSGEEVFSKLFAKLKPKTVFRFLDENGSWFNDLKVFTAPPTLPFTKALLEEIKKK